MVIAEWNIKLAISAPITIKHPLNLDVEKGSHNSFWTKVKVKKATQGVWIEVVARASSQEEANDAAVFFIGQMLDLLSLWIDLPLYLSLFDEKFRSVDTRVQRFVKEDEWSQAFRLSRNYALHRRAYSRALSWYRKGLISEDPIDKFLAFWSSIESVSSASARDNERTRRGIINKICDCFDQLWKDCSSWKVIPNDAPWINRFQETRNGISHGFIVVNIDTIKQISIQLPKLHQLAHTFLSDWEHHSSQENE
jgi:hypothetical protein